MIETVKKIKIQTDSMKMLSSSAYVFEPKYALYFGSPAEALIYQQLYYRARTNMKKSDNKLSVRFSYRRLAKMFSYSRKWVIEIIKRLEDKGVIEVQNSGYVNTIVFKEFDFNVTETSQNKAKMLVFPELVKKIGLLASIALQQVHIRQYKKGQDFYVIRSFQQWHDEVFMYISLSTVKRLFSELEKLNLLTKRKYECEVGVVNSYRVNYKGVAALLGLEYMESSMPKMGW